MVAVDLAVPSFSTLFGNASEQKMGQTTGKKRLFLKGTMGEENGEPNRSRSGAVSHLPSTGTRGSSLPFKPAIWFHGGKATRQVWQNHKSFFCRVNDLVSF